MKILKTNFFLFSTINISHIVLLPSTLALGIAYLLSKSEFLFRAKRNPKTNAFNCWFSSLTRILRWRISLYFSTFLIKLRKKGVKCSKKLYFSSIIAINFSGILFLFSFPSFTIFFLQNFSSQLYFVNKKRRRKKLSPLI